MIPPAVDFGNVAQLVEQGPFKAKVPGSSPGIPTILSRKATRKWGFLSGNFLMSGRESEWLANEMSVREVLRIALRE